MKLNVYFGIAFRIIFLFSIGMLMASIRPELHNLLGDTPGDTHVNSLIRDGYTWSGVHYWFWWMCFFLFILSLINCIMGIKNIIEKNY